MRNIFFLLLALAACNKPIKPAEKTQNYIPNVNTIGNLTDSIIKYGGHIDSSAMDTGYNYIYIDIHKDIMLYVIVRDTVGYNKTVMDTSMFNGIIRHISHKKPWYD